MSSDIFSFNFFVRMLGYHPEKRNDEVVFVKTIDRRRYSIVDKESMEEDYKEVCARLKSRKEVYAKCKTTRSK